VRNATSDTVAAARDTLSNTYQSGLAAATSAGDQLTETFTQSRDTLSQAIESNPFIVGGVGLLIGAVIASVLPVTHAENRLFGDTSDEIKDRAQDIATEGLHAATTAAQDVYHETVSRAQEQGFSAEVVRQAVKDVGEKVRGVVEQASEALDKNSSSGFSPLQK
jgi:gas vesicle protein